MSATAISAVRPGGCPRFGRFRCPSLLFRRIGGVLLVTAVSARAAEQGGALPETPGVSGGAMLQMLLGLALIVGLLFLGAYLLRRLGGGKAFGNTGPLRVVGGLMLSTRERIVLLEVGDAWIVVGVVPGQIKTLHTLPRGELPPGQGTENRIGAWFRHMAGHGNENE